MESKTETKNVLEKGERKQARSKNLEKAVEWLLGRQHEDGYWNAEVETNCCMEAQWIMALFFCDMDHENTKGVLDYILNNQREDGSWDIYHGAENGDINTTLECYVALRFSGHSPDAPHMKKARAWLLKHEWHKRIRVFTKYWLALFGEWPWDCTPSLPPEIMYFPKWVPFNIYNFAAWARASMMPLTIVTAQRPVKNLTPELRLDELYPEGREAINYSLEGNDGKVPLISWKNLFLKSDKLLHAYTRLNNINPIRKKAIEKAMDWILSHQDSDGYWGGIQPPWIYGIIAMHINGFSKDQINMSRALNAVNLHWAEETIHGTRIKASESPVWDTMLAAGALIDAGETGECKQLSEAIDYLIRMENRFYGDWSVLVGKDVEPSGWAFQRANNYYPDIDDTGIAIIALKKFRNLLHPSDSRIEKIDEVVERAANWIIAMQSKNGGWGAFDKDNTKTIVTKIPFCDFGEVLDPPSVDVTAHVVEALCYCGYTWKHPVIRKALEFIYSEQEDDGSWFGRWGVNYVYGTYCVLTALKAAGESANLPKIQKALDWLVGKQNPAGGWGETIASYMEPELSGKAHKSTASQTAWAVISLKAFKAYDEEAERGIDFLKKTQTADGTWNEKEFTGTGFPGYGLGAKIDLRNGAPLPQGKELSRGFMLRYDFYSHYFPIVALSKEGK